MADPLSAAAAIVSITVLTTQLLKLVQNLSSTKDPSVKLIRTKLMGERKKFANWMLVMKVTNIDDLEEKILPEDYETVRELFLDLLVFFEQAEKKLSSVNLQYGSSLAAKAKTLRARFLWIYGNFDDLRLLVETLESLNTTLYMIAEPPPKYMFPPEHESPPFRMHRGQAAEPHMEVMPTAEEGTEQARLHIKRPILHLYRKCLKALAFISAQKNGTAYGRSADTLTFKLKTWAMDFVDGSYSLDLILTRETKGEMLHEKLRTAIISAMVDVALIEEQLLGFLGRRSDDYDRRILEELQLELVAMLGTDEIVSIAVEQSSPVLNEEDPDEAMADAIQMLTSAVEGLDEITPAIRMLRRELILEEEQRESILLREEATKVTTGIQTKSGPQNVAAWLEQPIKSTTEIEKLLQAQEQAERARSGGAATTSAYSKLFRKERERLEEWRESIQMKGESSLGEEEKAKVKEILSGLEKELLPKPKVAEVKGKLDISKPAATAMDEKASKKKLDSLSNAVEALWQI